MTKITRLITHSGPFHADDLFAGALLTALYDLPIERTRDAEIIAAAGPDTIIFDVGNVYDADNQRFDHHQIDKPRRKDGLAYSSFGLTWKHHGLALIRTLHPALPEADIVEIHERVDQTLVRDVDAVDNGQIMPGQEGVTHPLSITSMLMTLRPDFDAEDPEAMDHHYRAAVQTAWFFLSGKIRQQAARLRSRQIVGAAIAGRVDPRWIELPQGMDYQGPILEAGTKAAEILFVVNPSGEEWQLNVVNIRNGSYIARKPLPEAWAGLRNDQLAAVTKVPDAIFSHTGRFFACAGSRAGIMAMLQQALDA